MWVRDLAQLHPIGLGGKGFRDQSLFFQKQREAFVTSSIEGCRPEGEARQGIAPGPAVEVVVELGAALDEQLPGRVGMIDQIQGPKLEVWNLRFGTCDRPIPEVWNLLLSQT